jgi:hypothetical protein
MRYEKIKSLEEEQFRRLTGVQHKTYSHMVDILKKAHEEKHKKGGRKPKLTIEDQLLMALEYLREYRTYFHIATSYGISESAAYKAIKWIEDTLIKHPDFALPGRKALLKNDSDIEVILVDVTETPVERPKKNKNNTTQAKRKGTP